MLVIKTVLEVYIDMLKLDLASVQEKILELEGLCPPGSELGGWSDGSGDCCCNNDINLKEEGSGLAGSSSEARPSNTSIAICYEKKVCECRLCQKPCLVEKLNGLFASFEALDQTTQAIHAVTSCSSSSAVSTGPEEFIEALKSLMSLLARYSPQDLFRYGVMELVFSVGTMKETTGCPTEAQVIVLRMYVRRITMVCFSILVEVTSIQGELLQLTGSTVDISTLGSPEPTISPLPQLPSDLEAGLEKEINILQATLTINIDIVQILERILKVDFTINTEGQSQSCDDVFSSVFRFFTLLVRSEYGPELEDLGRKVISISIGGSITLSSSCSDETIEAFQMTIAAVRDANLNIVATVTKVSQTLAVSRGLIVDVVSTTVSYEEQANQLAETLRINRMNCEGADRVGAKLLEFVDGREVVQDCQADADFKPLLDAIMNLMLTITSNIEDNNIFQKTEEIVTMIEHLDVPCIGIRIRIRIQTVVISIKDVVTTYVSQISLVEQRRLQITGSLSFSFEQEPEPFDFQRQQLKGLMFCGDFTDRSTQSILVSQQVLNTPYHQRIGLRV